MTTIKSTYLYDDKIPLKGGGILPYIPSTELTEGGFMLLEEKSLGIDKTTLTDFGGKYQWSDCDIFQTISREFMEETFCEYNIPYSSLKSLPPSHYISIEHYLCLLYDATFLMLDNHRIVEGRKRVVSRNKSVPEYFFRTCGVKFITFTEIYKMLRNNDQMLSGRIVKLLNVIFMTGTKSMTFSGCLSNIFTFNVQNLYLGGYIGYSDDYGDKPRDKILYQNWQKGLEKFYMDDIEYYDENQKVICVAGKFIKMKLEKGQWLDDEKHPELLKAKRAILPFVLPDPEVYIKGQKYDLTSLPKEIVKQILGKRFSDLHDVGDVLAVSKTFSRIGGEILINKIIQRQYFYRGCDEKITPNDVLYILSDYNRFHYSKGILRYLPQDFDWNELLRNDQIGKKIREFLVKNKMIPITSEEDILSQTFEISRYLLL